METLSSTFDDKINKIGMHGLSHPIFYNAPVGIRFEIGGDEGVYLDYPDSDGFIANAEYIYSALFRAKSIYESLSQKNIILRIDLYLEENYEVENTISFICKEIGFPQPHEQVLRPFQWDDDDEEISQLQLYWNLNAIVVSIDKLLMNIIIADICGCSLFASSVYFLDSENAILFHLYDDRGADLVAANKELIRPMFERFHSWILSFDSENINQLFLSI